MTSPDRSLIIPMKDESPRLGATFAALAASGLATGTTELIFVDDGSTDGSAEVAERLLEVHNLSGQVVRLGRNLGKGAAVRAGVYTARGHAVAFSDADLSAPIDAIEASFELIESGAVDVVVGTRAHLMSRVSAMQPIRRQWAGKVFNALVHRLGLTRYGDTQCGLKAFSHSAAALLFSELRIRRFAFDVELLLRAELAGLRVTELPVTWTHVGHSRVRLVRDGARMMADVVRLRRAIRAWQPVAASGVAAPPLPVIARLEREHWWFRSRQDLATRALGSHARDGTVLEVGCGTGGVIGRLVADGFQQVVGSDMSPVMLDYARGMGTKAVVCSVPETLPFPDAAFTHVVALDVLQYVDDDVSGLREYARVAGPNGRVVVAVPAYGWAWSDHDVALGHRRRYTAAQLRATARRAGLEVGHVSYFHAWLVPVALALAKSPLRLLAGRPDENSFVSPRFNRLFVALTAAERAVLRRTPLPFGLGILLVVRVRPKA